MPGLVEVLNGSDGELRVLAADAIAMIGPAARDAVPSLIHAIQHAGTNQKTEILTYSAIRALGRIGPAARSAVPALSDLFAKNHGEYFEVVIALDSIAHLRSGSCSRHSFAQAIRG